LYSGRKRILKKPWEKKRGSFGGGRSLLWEEIPIASEGTGELLRIGGEKKKGGLHFFFGGGGREVLKVLRLAGQGGGGGLI